MLDRIAFRVMGLAAWWDRNIWRKSRLNPEWRPAVQCEGRAGWKVFLPSPSGHAVARFIALEEVEDGFWDDSARLASPNCVEFLLPAWDGWRPGRYV